MSQYLRVRFYQARRFSFRQEWRFIATLLVLWAAITWNGDWFARLNLPLWNEASEFPLSDTRSLLVDAQGRIYAGIHYYNRIQVYDASGKYLHGWFVERSTGPFRMRLNEQGQIEVAIQRTDRVYTYDLAGKLVRNVIQAEAYNQFGSSNDNWHRDALGNVYEVRGGRYFPHITRNNVTIIRTKWYLWFIMAPFPSILWGVLAAIVILVSRNVNSQR